jgi:hypothetical protein
MSIWPFECQREAVEAIKKRLDVLEAAAKPGVERKQFYGPMEPVPSDAPVERSELAGRHRIVPDGLYRFLCYESGIHFKTGEKLAEPQEPEPESELAELRQEIIRKQQTIETQADNCQKALQRAEAAERELAEVNTQSRDYLARLETCRKNYDAATARADANQAAADTLAKLAAGEEADVVCCPGILVDRVTHQDALAAQDTLELLRKGGTVDGAWLRSDGRRLVDEKLRTAEKAIAERDALAAALADSEANSEARLNSWSDAVAQMQTAQSEKADLEKRLAERRETLDSQTQLSVQLSRIVEHLCADLPIPHELSHHGQIAKVYQKAKQREKAELQRITTKLSVERDDLLKEKADLDKRLAEQEKENDRRKGECGGFECVDSEELAELRRNDELWKDLPDVTREWATAAIAARKAVEVEPEPPKCSWCNRPAVEASETEWKCPTSGLRWPKEAAP